MTGIEFHELRRALGLSTRVVAVLLHAPSEAAVRRLERRDDVLPADAAAEWHAALTRAAARKNCHASEGDVLEAALRSVANEHTRAHRGQRQRA
jgi:hypothetical protein